MKGNLNKTNLQVELLNLNTIELQFDLNHVLYQCKSILIKQFAESLVGEILFLERKEQKGEHLLYFPPFFVDSNLDISPKMEANHYFEIIDKHPPYSAPLFID